MQLLQERLRDKLEKNRRELSDKLDHSPDRIIAGLNNAKGLLQGWTLKPSLFLDDGEVGRTVLGISNY